MIGYRKGINKPRQNTLRRMFNEGATVTQISKALKTDPEVVQRFVNQLNKTHKPVAKEAPANEPPANELQAKEPTAKRRGRPPKAEEPKEESEGE